jgi:4-hydroxybenzoate polyprenyltransferase
MRSIFKLFRINNLVLIILLQVFLRTYFISPMLNSFGLTLLLSDLQFILVLTMTFCITSAGYVINDYFDLKRDYINRNPDDVIVGKTIPRRTAMATHLVLSAIGILIGFYLSYALHVWVLALLPIFVVGLLWFYSTEYKRQFIIGNIVLAFVGVLPILLTLLYEPALFKAYLNPDYRAIAILIFKVIGFFTLIAFGINLLYALVKDLQDLAGDEATNCRTLPIVAGEMASKFTFTIVSVMLIFALFYIQNLQYANKAYVPLMYIVFGLELPLIIANVMLYLTNKTEKYKYVTQVVSVIMVVGVFAILVLNYFPGS